MDLLFLRVLLHQIFKNHAFQRVMFLLTQEAFIDCELRQRQLIVREATRGFRSTHQCWVCHGTQGLMMHYNGCNHQVHPSCGQDVKNCEVCGHEPDRMVERQLDRLVKIRP